MAQNIQGSLLAKPLYTLPTELSDVDSRNKIYINKDEKVSPETFSVLVNPYPHLRVHVHIKPDKTGTEEIGVGVYEIDAVQFTRDELEEINGTKVIAYHQVYSTAQGKESATEEDGYLNTTNNTDLTITTYNDKYKNIIFYASDTKKVYLNGELYGGGGEEKTYTPNASDDAKVDIQKVTAEALKGKSFNEVLDMVFFPEYDAFAGELPERAIDNDDEILEVGTSISNASYKVTKAGAPYGYIKNSDNKFITKSYECTTPVVTTTKGADNATFGTVTRSTSETTYKVTGPSSDELSNGKLYKSKGTPSTTSPKQVGEATKTLAAKDATITGVYKGGKDGSKSSIFIKADGTLSTSLTGTYGNTITYNVLNNNASIADHPFSDLGTKSVELYVPSGVSYTVKLTATKYNSLTNGFAEDTKLTSDLNSLAVTTTASTPTKTFTDAAGNNYQVRSCSINTSGINTGGKFVVNMSITKN